MKKIQSRALSEVYEVLQNSEELVINNIPTKFIDFIKNNKDNTYIPNIYFSNKNWTDSLSNEAKTVMALIYRDFLASDEERKKIIENEKVELEQFKKEKYEKYNPDKIFKVKKESMSQVELENNANNNQLVDISKEKWYKKILRKLFYLLKS